MIWKFINNGYGKKLIHRSLQYFKNKIWLLTLKYKKTSKNKSCGVKLRIRLVVFLFKIFLMKVFFLEVFSEKFHIKYLSKNTTSDFSYL